MRRDVGSHAHRDSLAAVNQQVRQAGREDGRLGEVSRIVVDEVDGVLSDVGEHRQGQRIQATLGVAGRGRRILGRAVVAMKVDEGVLQRERLSHPGQGVVDGCVAVGVEAGHHVTHHPGALDMAPVGTETLVVHRP